jgi:hypothetical protein
MPIMAFGLAVEARVFDRLPLPKREFGWWVVYLAIGMVIGLLTLAETVALAALGTDHAHSDDKSIVACGLVAGGVALYFGLVPQLIHSRGPWDSRVAPLRAATLAVPVVVVVFFLTRR